MARWVKTYSERIPFVNLDTAYYVEIRETNGSGYIDNYNGRAFAAIAYLTTYTSYSNEEVRVTAWVKTKAAATKSLARLVGLV